LRNCRSRQSGEAIKLLRTGEQDLLKSVRQLDEVGEISRNNTTKVGELGKRSQLINEMVEIIKDISNKTNMLSINASIEASRAGEAGRGFSVVAAEIRELSKETISSAKKVGEAGREIQELLDSIIISSESESKKTIECGVTMKGMSKNLEEIVIFVSNNYDFTQKIDVSIKQQESGSGQAAETMRQMSEIARQSAETARQTLTAVRDIVNFSEELNKTVARFSATDAVKIEKETM
jgi:methyl-accepting chemotaxis protein